MAEIEKIRQVISILECMAVDLTGCMGGLSKKDPLKDVCRQRLEAINTAQSSLRPVSREQVEKVWRGEWIDAYPGTSSCKCTKCGAVQEYESTFCCHCGAPMTDEAVEMVIERMEALHENRD